MTQNIGRVRTEPTDPGTMDFRQNRMAILQKLTTTSLLLTLSLIILVTTGRVFSQTGDSHAELHGARVRFEPSRDIKVQVR